MDALAPLANRYDWSRPIRHPRGSAPVVGNSNEQCIYMRRLVALSAACGACDVKLWVITSSRKWGKDPNYPLSFLADFNLKRFVVLHSGEIGIQFHFFVVKFSLEVSLENVCQLLAHRFEACV